MMVKWCFTNSTEKMFFAQKSGKVERENYNYLICNALVFCCEFKSGGQSGAKEVAKWCEYSSIVASVVF